MNLIYKVNDNDIGEKYTGINNPKTRLGARGIVIREDDKIVVFNKTKKKSNLLVVALMSVKCLKKLLKFKH